ncbi:DNA methyltransferase [Clostridia bacterium]|nr:DNA methyltransferase [Clostridia bacterium]
MTREKASGRFYTPAYLVSNILDLLGYSGSSILQKHVIDNSCGDGAFLTECVRRYCAAAQTAGTPVWRVASELARYIHGIEIDEVESSKCRENVSVAAAEFGIFGVLEVAWDINCADALTVGEYDGKMDFVVGNPPYIRVHNLADSYDVVKHYYFAQKGMVDSYLVFFEVGIKMLNNEGLMGVITPSSYFTSISGSALRQYLVNTRFIRAVANLKHFQPFDATAYTAITVLSKTSGSTIDYYEYDVTRLVAKKISTLDYDDFCFEDGFYFGDKRDLDELRQVLSFNNTECQVEVKNGLCTLCNDFFIGDLPFKEYTIPIIKASTGRSAKCLFPYDTNGKLIPYETLTQNAQIRDYYEENSERLRERDLERGNAWYGFGRTQGIRDIFKNKYAINSLIRDIDDLKLSWCAPRVGVYSGLYLLAGVSYDEIRGVLYTDDFMRYVRLLCKCKSGGYYTFSSKDLQKYLAYKLSGETW